jgi:hypothetical protein
VTGRIGLALPELTRRIVESQLDTFCERRVPPHVRDQVRLVYEIRGNNVTLLEERPYFLDPSTWTRMRIARVRFDQTSRRWKLYWRDRNGRWHDYTRLRPTPNLETVLAEIDLDPTGIFWG